MKSTSTLVHCVQLLIDVTRKALAEIVIHEVVWLFRAEPGCQKAEFKALSCYIYPVIVLVSELANLLTYGVFYIDEKTLPGHTPARSRIAYQRNTYPKRAILHFPDISLKVMCTATNRQFYWSSKKMAFRFLLFIFRKEHHGL